MHISSLPIVDISPFTGAKPVSHEAKLETARAIHAACRDFGFFYLKGHNIPQDVYETALRLGHEFFKLEETEKAKLGIANEDFARGYQRLGENVTRYQKDWHEALDFYKPIPRTHPLVINNQPLRGENQWPTCPAEFRPFFERYIEYMLDLGQKVMSAIAMGLGLEENFFVPFLDESFWVMRVIGYPPLQSSTGKDGIGVSCGEHTDYGCLTFLLQDNIKGSLQVQMKEGGWINADPIPGTYVVNIGDMLNIWTNNIYQSTMHRVVHKGDTYRVSCPFFYEPNFETLIEPLPQCLKLDPVKHHDPVVYGEHLLRKVMTNFEITEN
ncbi:1849_t:CDS:2 [Ambispora leptoticha]|uniref:1849_t:CDS:1 n=1 Tax=Ambispora leptoticha TaxID=144679 RepID=A0A9N9AP35_9GLOM|nr:1849_t:CDS:2 [Ambispora leptoticha]